MLWQPWPLDSIGDILQDRFKHVELDPAQKRALVSTVQIIYKSCNQIEPPSHNLREFYFYNI